MWSEYPGGQELWQRLAAGRADDLSQQQVVGVGVRPRRPRFERQRRDRGHRPHGLFLRRRAGDRDALGGQELDVVRDAAGVCTSWLSVTRPAHGGRPVRCSATVSSSESRPS